MKVEIVRKALAEITEPSYVMVSLDLKATSGGNREAFEVKMREHGWHEDEDVSTTWTKKFNMECEKAMKAAISELNKARNFAEIPAKKMPYVANVSRKEPVRFSTSP